MPACWVAGSPGPEADGIISAVTLADAVELLPSLMLIVMLSLVLPRPVAAGSSSANHKWQPSASACLHRSEPYRLRRRHVLPISHMKLYVHVICTPWLTVALIVSARSDGTGWSSTPGAGILPT